MVQKGHIALFACEFVPAGWAKCDGKNGTPNLPAFVYDKNARPIPYFIATEDNDYLLSMILPVAFNYAPDYWSDCDGQILTFNDNVAMGSLLGSNYGGNGYETFALPTIPNQVTAGEGTTRYIINTKGGAFPRRS